MEGRYSNRDFTSVELEEKRSQSSDDKEREISVQRQASGTLLEHEKTSYISLAMADDGQGELSS